MPSIEKEKLNKIKNEVLMSEKLNQDRLLPQLIEAYRRYTGKHVPAQASNWQICLNEIYPIIQYELPAIFFRNPRVFLKPRNKTFIAKRRNPMTGLMEEQTLESSKSAKTQEAILNYEIQEINYKEEVRRTLMDALMFKHGVLWHGYKGEFGMTEENSMYIEEEQLFVRHLSPMNFIFDPSVSLARLDEAKWIGRAFYVPKQDLIEDDTLEVSKILKGELGYANRVEEVDKTAEPRGGGDVKVIGETNKTLLDFASEDFKNSEYAKFVKVYELFIRPTKKEKRDGSKGHVLLYTKEQEKPLRVSVWPYKAMEWPAKILMFNYVPESVFGMSDIEVYGSIADQKNMVVNLQLRNAQSLSRNLVAISKQGTSEEDINKMLVGENAVVGFDTDTVNNKLSVVSMGGGASSELYLLDSRIQANLDEKSGVTDLRKGFLRSGEESATSVQIRNMGSSARPAYRQDLMADFLRSSCLYLNHLIKQFFPIDKAVRIVGSLDVEWSDDFTKEEIQADVDVELDVISMLPEDPQTEIQKNEVLLNLMVQALNNPNLMQKIMQEGNTFNISPIIEQLILRMKIRDPEVFRKIKPEESQGFVSIAEVRAAGQNVKAALGGQEPPSPPQPGQDHAARLEMYTDMYSLIEGLGETPAKALLQQLIQLQQVMQQNEQDEKNPELHKPIKLSSSSPRTQNV